MPEKKTIQRSRPLIAVIGAAKPGPDYTRKKGVAIGYKLREFLGGDRDGTIFTGGVEGVGVDVRKLHDKIDILTTQFKKTFPLLREMGAKRMPRDTSSLEKLFNPKSPRTTSNGHPQNLFPKYLVEAAMERYRKEGDKTAWGYYNAFTAAITHDLQTKNPQISLDYGKIAWNVAQKMMAGKITPTAL